MNQHVLIRDETDADISAITEVTIAAFKTLEISNKTEQYIIEALRAAKALTVSLVAEVDGRVVGHIAFSPVTISDGSRNWHGLGPVSVLPEYQRKGVGKALIAAGLSRLKELNAQGCCLVGHPGYYDRFGFKNVPGLVHEGVAREVFFALSFAAHMPQGSVTFHESFKADGQQGDETVPAVLPGQGKAMSVTVREYQPADLERCRQLWRWLTQRHREIYDDPTLGGPDPGVEFDTYLKHPQLNRVWVAECRNEILGFCGLLVHDEESELEPIVVAPGHRNLGIGAVLAQQAISQSRALGVKYVNVRPVARNLEAIRFFHREGFRLLGRFELSIALEAASPFGSSRTTEIHGLRFEY